jgi:hypothetical protein
VDHDPAARVHVEWIHVATENGSIQLVPGARVGAPPCRLLALSHEPLASARLARWHRSCRDWERAQRAALRRASICAVSAATCAFAKRSEALAYSEAFVASDRIRPYDGIHLT